MNDDDEVKMVGLGEIECLKANPRKTWEMAVWDRYRHRCGNCGSDDHLRTKMVVPEEAGGQLVDSNGILLCRTCDLVSSSIGTSKHNARRPVNFWVSEELYQRLNNGLGTRNGFNSMGSMVRFLMSKYVTDQSRFDDLQQYQDGRPGEVKINVWVDSKQYETFKHMVDLKGGTVTDSLKALIRMYECEAEPLMRMPKERGKDE